MDEYRVRELYFPKALFFMKLVTRKFLDQPGLYQPFSRIWTEYTCGRIDHRDMYNGVSGIFSAHPDVIELFGKCFPRANSTKRVNEHDFTETLISDKRAKIENDSSKATTVFDPTSNASTSYASNCTLSPCSSGCYPFEGNTVASGSTISSQSWPGYFAEAYEAQNEKTAQLRDTILYVTETNTKLLNEPLAYQHLIKLVNEIGVSRIDTWAIMERASKLLQGYRELIESFNIFLPDGYRIVILSDDHEMSTD